MTYRRKLSATHKARISKGRMGKKHTQATKDKISKKIKELWNRVEKNNEDITKTK